MRLPALTLASLMKSAVRTSDATTIMPIPPRNKRAFTLKTTNLIKLLSFPMVIDRPALYCSLKIRQVTLVLIYAFPVVSACTRRFFWPGSDERPANKRPDRRRRASRAKTKQKVCLLVLSLQARCSVWIVYPAVEPFLCPPPRTHRTHEDACVCA